MSEAFDDPVNGERRDIGPWIFEQCETGISFADLGHGGGSSSRQQAPFRDGDLCFRSSGRDKINQIVFPQQRRMLQNRQCDIRLVRSQGVHDDLWGLLTGCKYFRERASNQR